ncbi:hypothetical protein [Natrinema soli]|uniref:Uncharacterized protein n=1 Tax=Natrinema soli TaxID=1930624 RepID=A0ABD5SMC5_9EURY|nr:hypothetical protein [Natrinema soli]
MSQSDSKSEIRFIDTDEDDPLSFCRQHPDAVREAKQQAEEEGYNAFAAACDAVLEEVDPDE